MQLPTPFQTVVFAVALAIAAAGYASELPRLGEQGQRWLGQAYHQVECSLYRQSGLEPATCGGRP